MTWVPLPERSAHMAYGFALRVLDDTGIGVQADLGEPCDHEIRGTPTVPAP